MTTMKLNYGQKTVAEEEWDEEWALEWLKISELFDSIDQLKNIFISLEVSVLRELTQRQLILNLERYAYSLSKHIEEKYKVS